MSLLILSHCQNKVTTLYPFLYFCKQRCISPYLGMYLPQFLWNYTKLDGHCCSASLSSATWFFLPRAWLLRRNRPQWGFVELHRCLTQTWCQMDDASPRWPIDAHGCASWLRRLVKLIDFQWKTSCLPLVLFACYAQRWYPSSVHLGCVGDAVVFHVGAILSHNWLWTKCFLEEGSTLVLRA